MSELQIKAVTDACSAGIASFDPNVIWWDRVFDIFTGVLIAVGCAAALLGVLYLMALAEATDRRASK